jgi:predicted Rossmann fold nucleotide-binding protein DprA/Smf involved in DNA uptake
VEGVRTSVPDRRELSYWLTFAFRLDREPRRSLNGLVLTADRKLHLGLVDLVRLEPSERPPEIARYESTLDRLLAAEGRVSAQAFVVGKLVASGARVVPITDPFYPPHLARLLGAGRAPTVLTVLGDPTLLSEPGVAVSGTRNARPEGRAFAREVGRALARANVTLVCGLAPGVDSAALEGALEAGGRVVGVAAEGLLEIGWRRRPEIQQGRLAVVSEFAPDDRWAARRAMARNRTIAGLSNALVIAECHGPGGTTNQLEVHRAAGLPIYLRRGPGEGRICAELSRLRGVTPWSWTSGPVTWPPGDVPAGTSSRPSATDRARIAPAAHGEDPS